MDVSAGAEFEKLIELMAKLRGPNGCSWDREQTMASLRAFVLEEAYELVDAIGQNNTEAVCEELGDLLLEVVFVAQVGIEAGAFTMPDIVRGIRENLIRRHPHVFGSKTADGAGEALAHWEDIKAKEKPSRKSHLDGVPRSLPALSRAAKISKRAAHAGFDWDSREQVLEKIDEEILELKEAVRAGDESSVHEELGDLLFAIVQFCTALENGWRGSSLGREREVPKALSVHGKAARRRGEIHRVHRDGGARAAMGGSQKLIRAGRSRRSSARPYGYGRSPYRYGQFGDIRSRAPSTGGAHGQTAAGAMERVGQR